MTSLVRIDYRHMIGIRQDIPVPQVVYTGPGDVVSGALGWWGLRAYSNATKGTAAVRIRRASDNAEQDFSTSASGALDRASIVTFLTSTTGQIVTLYDQVGTNHFTQATSALQPTVNLSGIGSLVTADFDDPSQHSLSTGSAISRAQPYTFGVVSKFTNAGAQSELFAETANLILMGYRSAGANEVYIYGTGTATATASDGAYHALGALYNGASSNIYVDGSSNAVSTGTASLGAVGKFGGRSSVEFNGGLAEFGIWPAAWSGTDASNMSGNQHTFWGF